MPVLESLLCWTAKSRVKTLLLRADMDALPIRGKRS